MVGAGAIVKWWIGFTQPPQPTLQMGVAAELREPAHLRESAMEIVQKPADHVSIGVDGAGPLVERKNLDLRLEDLVESEFGLAHRMVGVDKWVRFWTARAYSFQTSWGASWTYSMVVWI